MHYEPINFMSQYYYLLIYTVLAPAITVLILFLNHLAAPKRLDVEKSMAYECGFDPFVDTRIPFDVAFYLVAILFLIFDIEVAFLFPWALSLKALGWTGFSTLCVFLFILLVGFFYEWRKGALDWN